MLCNKFETIFLNFSHENSEFDTSKSKNIFYGNRIIGLHRGKLDHKESYERRKDALNSDANAEMDTSCDAYGNLYEEVYK